MSTPDHRAPARSPAPPAAPPATDAAHQERIRLQEQLSKVAASVPGLIYSFRLAPDGTASMPYASPAILDLYGITPAAVAHSFAPIAAGIHPADAPGVQASIEASARRLTPWHAEFRYRHPHKGEIWVEGHSLPLREADGATLWHGYIQDITQRKRAEQALANAQADLNRAQTLGQTGSWRLDIRTGQITWSSGNYRIFGIPPGTPVSYDSFLAIVHPADRAFVHARWQAGLAGEPYDIEHRILVDGKVKWVREQAELEFDDEDRLTSGFGTTQDITERRAAAEQLRAQLRLTKAITDCAADAIFVTDAQDRVTFMNPEAEHTFGYGPPEVIGRVLHEVIHHQHPQASPAPTSQPGAEPSPDSGPEPDDDGPAARRGEHHAPRRNRAAVYVRKDGSTLTATVSSAPLEIDGQPRGAVLVAHDITEIKRAQASLLDADRRKDEFLAMLAHELRNPLAPIRNAAHILGLLDTGEPRVRWAQRIIEQQAAHLTRLVDELLDVSRIARGEILLKPESIDFAELARQVVESTGHLLEAKGHQLRLDLPAEPLWLRGDLVRLSQVLVNLIDNAVKYTPPHGRLHLFAEPQGEELAIVLEDNGVGIAPELLPHVFDLFQQGSRRLDRARGGLGLGLTLVRRLVQAHGGRVLAESVGAGRGTRIRVWLPREPVAPEPPAGVATAAAGAAHLRILVVDDEAAVADSTALLLRLDGHAVQVARTGPAALQIAAAFRPQAVLLDIGLRGMDGYQTARCLRAGPRGADLCLIAVTGYGDAKARELARAAGFDHYLVKPVEPEQLKQLLAGLAAGPGAP